MVRDTKNSYRRIRKASQKVLKIREKSCNFSKKVIYCVHPELGIFDRTGYFKKQRILE